MARLQPFTVGYLGRIAPEKGCPPCSATPTTACASRASSEGCRLELAGYLGPEHQAYMEGMVRQVREWGLEEEIHYRGVLELDDKVAFLQRLDVFAVPATYDDPKGLSLVEAMASGVPVVAARRGTYVELIERTGGGVLIPSEDGEALMTELLRLRSDEALRATLGASAAAAVREHYTAEVMARRAAEVYRRVCPSRVDRVSSAASGL